MPPEGPTPPYPSPQENPDFYTTITPTSGVSVFADTVVAATKGTVQQLPYQCTPFVSSIIPFIGSQVVDRFTCEFKGGLSLYVNHTFGFVNATILLLLLFGYFIATSEGKEARASESSKWAFRFMLVAWFAILVVGADFVYFTATAFVLFLKGAQFSG